MFETPEVVYKMAMKESSDLDGVSLDIGEGSFYLPKGFGAMLANRKSRRKRELSPTGPHTVPVGVEVRTH